MVKKPPASGRTAEQEHPLAGQLERVVGELQLLRQVLDEIHTSLQWAVQNCLVPVAEPESRFERPSCLTMFDEGDAVEVDHNRLQAFGEVVEVNDAENSATVLLIPSNETVTVPQDSLKKVDRTVCGGCVANSRRVCRPKPKTLPIKTPSQPKIQLRSDVCFDSQ